MSDTMAIGIYIPHIDNRSVDSESPARSVSQRLADEGLASNADQLDIELRMRTNRAGYPCYSAFVHVKDEGWGRPEDVTHILRAVHSGSGYRLYTDNRGHHWVLLPNRRDEEEHAALARTQVDFELDMDADVQSAVEAANRIGSWYSRILFRRKVNICWCDYTKVWINKAVELELPCTKGDFTGIC